MSETQNQNIQYLYSELNSNPNYIRNWAKEVISFSSEYNNSVSKLNLTQLILNK